MKKKLILTAITALLAFPFSCGNDPSTTEDVAKKAAKEFCDCYKNNSLSYCEDKLNSSYGSYVDDDDFYTTFNNDNDCGVTISKTTK